MSAIDYAAIRRKTKSAEYGSALQIAGPLAAQTGKVAAVRVEALYRRDVLQRPVAVPLRNVQLQPRNVFGAGAGRVPDHLAQNGRRRRSPIVGPA